LNLPRSPGFWRCLPLALLLAGDAQTLAAAASDDQLSIKLE